MNEKIKTNPYMHILYIAMLLTALVTACDDDEPTKKKPPEEKISYLHTVKNELNHSSHTYYYYANHTIRRYIGEDYWSDFYYDSKDRLIKEEAWNDEGSEIIGITEFSYNSEGMLDTVEVLKYNDGVFSMKTDIIALEYNQKNQIIKETVYYPGIFEMERMLYEYDEKGNQTRMELYYVYNDTIIFAQSVVYEYDTCKNAHRGINYPFCYSLPRKSIHDYPHLSKVNNITRVDVFDRNGELNWYLVYDYQNYTENSYPQDVIKTLYNNRSEVLFEYYRRFTYLEE